MPDRALQLNLAELERYIGELDDKIQKLNPHNFWGLFMFLVIADVIGAIINILDFIPFVGIAIAWFFQFILFVAIQLSLIMQSDTFRYARRAKLYIRVASYLELIPILGALPMYFVSIVFARQVAKRQQREAMKTRDAAIEDYLALAGHMEQQIRAAQESAANDNETQARSQREEYEAIRAITQNLGTAKAANDNERNEQRTPRTPPLVA